MFIESIMAASRKTNFGEKNVYLGVVTSQNG